MGVGRPGFGISEIGTDTEPQRRALTDDERTDRRLDRGGDPTLGGIERVAEVLDVVGEHGRPPYRVRWSDGREVIYYPGPGARVSSDPPSARRPVRAGRPAFA